MRKQGIMAFAGVLAGMLSAAEMPFVFISPAEPKVQSYQVPAAFARSFDNAKEVVKAEIEATALGCFELYVNDRLVAEFDGENRLDFLRPGFTHALKRRNSFSYDVTGLWAKTPGARTTVSAFVAPSWFSDEIVLSRQEVKPAFAAKIRLTYRDGTTEALATDTDWSASFATPFLSADIFWGERFDARRESRASVSAAAGRAERNTAFTGVIERVSGAQVSLRRDLALTPVEAYVWKGASGASGTNAFGRVNRLRSYRPGEMMTLEKGETLVVDFGQNAAAIPEIAAVGAAGVELKFRAAEMLNDANGEVARGNDGPAGSVYRANYRKLKDDGALVAYTFAGAGEERYLPTFTFQGYRYGSITVTGPVTIRSIRSIPVTSIARSLERGTLVTGNADVNRLISNVRWGQLSNYLSIPTDCPQRDERQGWTADTQVFCEAGSFNADTAAFFHKWMKDLTDTQRPSGAYTGVAPYGEYDDAGAMRFGWSDAGVIVPWTIWKQFGDQAIIRENWESMVKYLKRVHATKFAMANIIEECDDYQWGDWLSYEPLESCSAAAFDTTTGRWIARVDARHYWDYLGGCYALYDCRLMAEMARVIGRTEEARLYGEWAGEIERYLKRMFFQTADGMLSVPLLRTMQTPAVFALKFGLVEGEARARTAAELRANIAAHGDCLQTGFLGTSFLMEALTENGMADIAYTLLLQHKNPSWLYSVDQGATTIWERWNSYTKKDGFGNVGMNSFNHYAYGAVLAWLYKTAAGIAATSEDPGFKTIIMKPVPDRRLKSVTASYLSSAGRIESAWRYEGDKWIWTFTVPEGAKALVTLPGETVAKPYPAGSYTLTK